MSLVQSSLRKSRIARNAVNAGRGVLALGSALGGLCEYYSRGDVSARARASVLNLHCGTNGRFTDGLAALLRVVRPPRRPAEVSGLLGKLSVDEQDAIVRRLATDGFYVFDRLLPAELCDEIEGYASQTPATVEGRSSKDRVVLDERRPISKTYRIVEADVVKSHAMQRLMADPSFLAIAERYLKTLPILSMMNLWWSLAFGDEPGSEAAQEFHFDFDPPPVWLLFFVYVTDVGPENGPHVFARGSHVAGHPAAGALLRRGYVRIPDEDVAAAFGRDNVVELCGKRGTVLAVDTRGFHKGKMLRAGHRLMAQLTFSCPPFSGAHGRSQPLPADLHPELAAAIADRPKVYERYR
jgi:hypothetical protein